MKGVEGHPQYGKRGWVLRVLQAMDRCHRIGQVKPVLVLRLATAHSVEGKLLRRARSKLALERLVIKKGAFLPGETVPPRPHQRICHLARQAGVCVGLRHVRCGYGRRRTRREPP